MDPPLRGAGLLLRQIEARANGKRKKTESLFEVEEILSSQEDEQQQPPKRGGGKHDDYTYELLEYPESASDEDFALYHYRIFTAYTAATVGGASRYDKPLKLWYSWMMTFEDSVVQATERSKQHIPAIAAGHYWEEAITQLAAILVLGEPFLQHRIFIRKSGPLQEVEHDDVRATPDALVCNRQGFTAKEPRAIEAKFKTREMPSRPDQEHLFQLTHQMGVLKTKQIYIAYGHCPGASINDNFKDGEPIRVRVFRVNFSPILWDWMLARMQHFAQCIHTSTRPNDIPDISRYITNYWASRASMDPNAARMTVELPGSKRVVLPPQPLWELVGETRPYANEELAMLPKRLSARPNLPKPSQKKQPE